MQSDNAAPPKVLAMISVFDSKKEQPLPATKASVTPPTVGVSIPRRKLKEAGSPEKKPQNQTEEAKPVTMTGPFKLIHVSGSGQVVDEKAPMLSRTLNHFKSGGNLSSTYSATNKHVSGKGVAKEPAIRPMGYQSSPAYGGRKVSAPVTINCSVPRKERKAQEKLKESEEEEEESVLSKSTPQFSSATLSPNHSSDSHSVSPSPPKKPYPQQSSLPPEATPTTSPRAIKQPGGTWFPSSRQSYRSTEAPPPVQFRVRTWDRLSTGDARPVKRSKSFTSRVKTEVSSERQRSTSPSSSSSSSSSSSPQKKPLGSAKSNSIDLNTRSQSALAGSLTEEDIDERISASVNTSPAPIRRDDKSKSVVLSPQISVEVTRRNKYGSATRSHGTSGKTTSPQLASRSRNSTASVTAASSNPSLPPPVPAPKPTRSTDSHKSQTLPSRRSVGGYSPTHSSSTNRISQYQPKGGPSTGFMKRDSPRDGSSPTMGSSKRETVTPVRKEGSPVFPSTKRHSLKKESSPVLSTRNVRKEGSPVLPTKRDIPRRGSPNLPSTKRESLALARKDAPKSEAGGLATTSKLQRPVQRSHDYANVEFSRDDTSTEGKKQSIDIDSHHGSTTSDHIDCSPTQEKKMRRVERRDSKDKSMTLPASSRTTGPIKKQHDTESVTPSSPRLTRLAMERRGSPSTPPLSIKSRIAIFQTKEDVPLSSTLPRNMYSSSNKSVARPKSEYNQAPLMRERDPKAKDKRKSLPAPPIAPKPRKSAVSKVILESLPNTLEEEDNDGEGRDETRRRGRMRIYSDTADASNDSEIKIHIFNDSEPEQATTDTPVNVYDDVVFSEDKVERADKPRSTRYSYQEYTIMRRMNLLRNSTSTSSLSETNNNNKGLAAIPENTLSVGLNKKEKEIEEEKEEEPDILKRMSVISGTFYEEMIDSIALKLASSEERGAIGEGASLERIEKVKRQLIEVVEDAVSNDPLLESEGFYESLEEYGRKVSDYLHRTQAESTSEEVPPELPPRPDFLLKLIKEEKEGEDVDRAEMSSPSILKLEGYEEMSSATIDVQPSSTVSLYEPVSYGGSDITMSPKGKGKRRTSKIPFWKSPEHKPSSPTLSLDSATSSLSRSGGNKKSTKKKKIIPSFSVRRSVKVEPTITSPVRSVSVSGHSSHSVTSSPSHTTYEEMNAPTSSSPPPHMYVNVGRSVSVSQPRGHYEFVSNDEPIQPTYSSESEGEGMSGVYDDIRSPVKRLWKDIEPPTTPDSSVFTDDHDTCDGRSLHDPTASPLVTKIKSTLPTHQFLRTSISDSALHSSLIAAQIGRPVPPTSPIPSFGEMSIDSNSNMESSPSICSYDSTRYSGGVGGVELKTSPMCSSSRKRVKSDASEDRHHSARKGAEQKARLMMVANHRRKRRGSVPGNPDTSSVSIHVHVIQIPCIHVHV